LFFSSVQLVFGLPVFAIASLLVVAVLGFFPLRAENFVLGIAKTKLNNTGENPM